MAVTGMGDDVDGGYPFSGDTPLIGGDWNQGNDDFDAGDVDCGCVGDILSNLLSDDS